MQERRKLECRTNQRNRVPILAVLTLPIRDIVQSTKVWKTKGTTSTKEIQSTRSDTERHGRRSEHDMLSSIRFVRCVYKKERSYRLNRCITRYHLLRVEHMTRTT